MRALSSMVRYSCTMRDDMLHSRDRRRVGPCLSALVCRAWLAIGLLAFFAIGGGIAQAAESTPPPALPFSPPVVRLNLPEAMALFLKQNLDLLIAKYGI